jgi:hypothetical protein
MVLEQPGDDASPAVGGVAVAVDEQDRGPGAGVDDVRAYARYVNQPVLEGIALRVV